MNEIPRKPIFIQDQRLSRLVLRPEDRGDKLKQLRSQHGGEAWESRKEFSEEELRDASRWQTLDHRLELFSQFLSKGRVLLCITAYAGIGKSMVLHQIDGLLSSACEAMDVVRVEFSDLPNDWEQYLHKPWLGDDPFLVRVISDQWSTQTKDNPSLPPLDKENVRDWLGAKIRTGAFVLLVDGLDEYNNPSASKKAEQLRHLLLEVFPKLHCMVAGRPHAITNELWLSLFSDSLESIKNSPCSDWEFIRVEIFDREQLERFLGKEMADQLKMLEAEIEFSPRNLEALRTLDETTRASIRSTADLYWHSIVRSLPRDNRELMGEKLLHTNLSVNEIMHMLSAIGITMALWHDDPQYPSMESENPNEFGANIPIPTQDAESVKETQSNPGVMEIGGAYGPPMVAFRERVFERLLEVYPTWSNFESTTNRSIVELRYEELVRLNSQYVEFGFLVERTASHVRWRNATLRDFFAALWMSSRATECERDAIHRRMDVARDVRDSSIAVMWQMICGMPPDIVRLCAGANDTERNLSWHRMIHPLFRSAKQENRFHGRPTELMYRAWPGVLYRAGFLRSLDWAEYDILVATTIAQQFFDTKAKSPTPEHYTIKDRNAWSILGGFLQQYTFLRDGNDRKSRIIREYMEDHWCDCDSRALMVVRVGHADETDNVERDELLKHAFSLCAYQVTHSIFSLFDASYARRFENDDRFCPEYHGAQINLSWYDSMMFCIWSHGYLPGEWEWEYASRTNMKTKKGRNAKFFWGDEEILSSEFAWTKENSMRVSHVVGSRSANKFGLYDTAGNVWEWCRDRTAKSKLCVLRGGSYDWLSHNSACSHRLISQPYDAYRDYGCRVSRVRDLYPDSPRQAIHPIELLKDDFQAKSNSRSDLPFG